MNSSIKCIKCQYKDQAQLIILSIKILNFILIKVIVHNPKIILIKNSKINTYKIIKTQDIC